MFERTPSLLGTEMSVFSYDISSKEIDEISDTYDISKVRSLDLSRNIFNSLDFLEKCPDIIELDVSNNQLSSGLENLSKLEFISILNLSSNMFQTFQGFPMLQTLSKLDISNNTLLSAMHLPELPFIIELNLSDNSIDDLSLPSLPRLQTLNISGNVIKELVLPRLPSLRQLDVSKNNISNIMTFDEDDFPYLWQLDLRYNSISQPDVLRSLIRLPMLFNLRIQGNPFIQENGSHKPPVLVILPTLTQLDDEVVNAKDKVKAQLKINGMIQH